MGFSSVMNGARRNGLLVSADDLPPEMRRQFGLPDWPTGSGTSPMGMLLPKYRPSDRPDEYLATSNFPIVVLDRPQVTLTPSYGVIGARGWTAPTNGTVIVQATITGAACSLTVTKNGGGSWNKLGGGINLPTGAVTPPLPVLVTAGTQFDVSASVATVVALTVLFTPSLLEIGGGAPGGTQDVNVDAATLSSTVTMQNAATAIGLGTALPVSGDGVASIDLQITGTATVTWKGKGAGGNTYSIPARCRSAMTAPALTATASGLYEINTRGLSDVYADITAYTSGTVTATGVAQPLGAAADQVGVTGAFASSANGTTDPGAGGFVQALSQAYLSGTGKWYPLTMSGDGQSLQVVLTNGSSSHMGTLSSGTNSIYPSPYSGIGVAAITTATTTAVKASAGVVGTIINTGGANSAGTLTVYDNTSASGKKIAALVAGVTPNQPIFLGIPCLVGITIVTSAADSWAVSYA